MKDNIFPVSEQEKPTYTTLVDYMKSLGINCPFEIHVGEPCKKRKGKMMVLVAETGRWRGWLAQKLLHFSFWLGKFTYESITDLEE